MKIHIEIPDEIHKKMIALKKIEGKTFQYLVAKLLQNYFKKKVTPKI